MTTPLSLPAPDDSGEFILYQTEDGRTRLEVRLEQETVWLSQKTMAELFQTTPQNIMQHIAARSSALAITAILNFRGR